MALQRHSTSARQLAMKAQAAGHQIVYTTLNQIRNGTYKSVPNSYTIKAIAWLAGVREEVAFTAAGQTVPGPPLADELPPGADNLSPKSRKVVLDMVRVLVDLEAGNHDTQDKLQTNPPGKRALRAVGSSREAGQEQKNPSDISADSIRIQAYRVRNSLLEAAEDRPDVISRVNLDTLLLDPEWYRQVGVAEDMLMDATAMRGFREILLRELCTLEIMREAFDQHPQTVEEHLDWLDAKFQDALRNDPTYLTPPPIEQLAAHPHFKTHREKFEEAYGERGEENQDPEEQN